MGIWTELLTTPPRTVTDDFFELGAESLTVVRFLAVVQERYGVELPVDELFAADFTVTAAATLIDETLLGGVTGDQLAELLDELEGMSEQDVRALLDDTSPLGETST
ncbi:Phosphopantetheine attachment site [Nonomuraea solani]|uniref:Phosphopantetheine attachment site n=1 Tax=Nonomuraea solani TaxID=1144553 RepID=A0A1H6EUZ0_9ACTN|nr:phosphopantetheine-binding protein [Nonomuraea solani]SEH00745.1 Phosphopantetheine attachment site [Nonomuraea solani]